MVTSFCYLVFFFLFSVGFEMSLRLLGVCLVWCLLTLSSARSSVVDLFSIRNWCVFT